jgi:hypothetical protein
MIRTTPLISTKTTHFKNGWFLGFLTQRRELTKLSNEDVEIFFKVRKVLDGNYMFNNTIYHGSCLSCITQYISIKNCEQCHCYGHTHANWDNGIYNVRNYENNNPRERIVKTKKELE